MPEVEALGPDGEAYWVRVSPIDWWWARRYKWRLTQNGHVYRNRSYAPEPENGRVWRVCRRVYLHRELMGLEHGDALVVNHLNRDPTDNRRDNLEVVTHADNVRHWMRDDGLLREEESGGVHVGQGINALRDVRRPRSRTGTPRRVLLCQVPPDLLPLELEPQPIHGGQRTMKTKTEATSQAHDHAKAGGVGAW